MISLNFILYLTENEHILAKQKIAEYCNANMVCLDYYRKLRPHIPLHREVQVTAQPHILSEFINEMNEVLTHTPPDQQR